MYSLAKAGFTQSYTYFTWRNTKADLTEYFTEISNPPVSDFFRPNVWPNTPDILHAQFQIEDLAQRRAIFQQRIILATTLSANYGIYGPAYELLEGRPAKPSPGKTSSEEYLDSEKYQLRTWDRTDPNSIAPLIHAAKPNPPQQPRAPAQREPPLPHRPQRQPPRLLQIHRRPHQHHPHRRQPRSATPSKATGSISHARISTSPGKATFDVEDLLTGKLYHWDRPMELRLPNPHRHRPHLPHPPNLNANLIP